MQVLLCLKKRDVEQFDLIAPGFKALAISRATEYTIKVLRSAKEPEEAAEAKPPPPPNEETPLRYLSAWARIVSKLDSPSISLHRPPSPSIALHRPPSPSSLHLPLRLTQPRPISR